MKFSSLCVLIRLLTYVAEQISPNVAKYVDCMYLLVIKTMNVFG